MRRGDKQILDRLALTISPAPEKDLLHSYSRWCKLLSHIKSKYELYPELAYNIEKNINRLHFHGVIYCENKIDFQKDVEYLKSLCFICIKPITKIEGWNKYCKKERKITLKTLNIKVKNYPLTHTNNPKIENENINMSIQEWIDKYYKQ